MAIIIQGGIRPHETFEPSSGASLGYCQGETGGGHSVPSRWTTESKGMFPGAQRLLLPQGQSEAIWKMMSLCLPGSAHSSKPHQAMSSSCPSLKRAFNVCHSLLSFPSGQALSLPPGWASAYYSLQTVVLTPGGWV